MAIVRIECKKVTELLVTKVKNVTSILHKKILVAQL